MYDVAPGCGEPIIKCARGKWTARVDYSAAALKLDAQNILLIDRSARFLSGL